MLYTNNIYIPYHKENQNDENFIKYKFYYESIGFVVNKFEYDDSDNYYQVVNNLFNNTQDEVLIIIDNIILPFYSIMQAVDISLKEKAIVKPMHRMFMIDDLYDAQKIIETLIENEILDSFNYSNNDFYTMWPKDNSFVINRSSLLDIDLDLENYLYFGLNAIYLSSIFNKIIFIESDSYKLNYKKIFIDRSIESIYKEYFTSLINLFDISENIYLYNNEGLNKIKLDIIKNEVLNLEEFSHFVRYR